MRTTIPLVRRLTINSASLTITSYVAQIANLFLYLLAARVLGPAVFGPIAGLIGIAILVGSFADFGINGITTRALAQDSTSIEPFRRTLGAKLAISLILAALWLTIALASPEPPPLHWSTVFMSGYLLLLILGGTMTVPFRAMERMGVVGIVAAVEKSVALGAWLLLQHFAAGHPEVLSLAMTVGGAAALVVATTMLPRGHLRLSVPSARQVAALWSSSFSFGVVGAASQLMRADVAIVGSVAGPYVAGLYAAPSRLASFVTVLPSSFSSAVFPRLASGRGGRTVRLQAAFGGAIVMAIMATGLITLAVFAPYVVPLALGRAYVGSVVVFRVYMLVIFLNSANQPLLSFLQAEGHEVYAARAVGLSAVIGLVSIAVGARLDGGAGAACGAVLMQALQMAGMAYKAYRETRSSRRDTAEAEYIRNLGDRTSGTRLPKDESKSLGDT